ncbi:hypothetical protein [Nocardioides jensenii]|uniref:hypothetical protein n=1 Tax=Nocardioides jensenii TaxID=1843 RepID=UPI000AE6D0DD|nr:hypothetical protein [Nocardioides jensenii]
MTRSRRLLGSAAAGFAAVCLLAPAAAYDAGADDESVELATSVDDAPVIGVGRYTVPLPDSSASGYFAVERTIDDSTIWVGETVFAPKPVYSYLYLTESADGSTQDCGVGVSVDSHVRRHEFLAGAIASQGACTTSDKVVLGHQGWDAAKVPNADAEVIVWEEPPVSDASILPPPALASKWDSAVSPDKGTAELGHTYADAPELVGGRWDVHVDPGRTALFKVPLDWNQHLQLHMSYDGDETTESKRVEPILITPVGGKSQWGEAVDGPDGEAPTYGDIDSKYPSLDGGVVSPSITWRNRESDGVTAAFPGTYYVMLQMPVDEIGAGGLDFTIDTRVVTDRPAKSPYSQDAEAIPALDGSDPVEESSQDRADDSSSSEQTPWGAVGGLFAGSAAMAAVGVVALGRHRRSRA